MNYYDSGSFTPAPSPVSTFTYSLDSGIPTEMVIMIVICLVPFGVAVIVCSLVICFYRRKLKRRRDVEAALNSYLIVRASTSGNGNTLQQPNRSTTTNSEKIFSYEELVKATDDFATTNLLGKGGFGYVYKGVLEDGTEVAVKKRKEDSRQGEGEFQAEIQTISRVPDHRHLVCLIGYCISGSQRLLVYEFLPNKTLEFHLHEKGRPVMEWANRMKIALGSAKGLSYLHEDCKPKIIHRDIKAANILIDDTFEAKVADFGLARSPVDADSHVSTRVAGTHGYLDPDYCASGQLRDKSDVFSFGVVLLELITGRKPLVRSRSPDDDDDILADSAKPLMIEALGNGKFEGLVDPRLVDYDVIEMKRVIACASACVRSSAKDRPKMSQIFLVLQGCSSLDTLTEGVDSSKCTFHSLEESSVYNSAESKEDMI